MDWLTEYTKQKISDEWSDIEKIVPKIFDIIFDIVDFLISHPILGLVALGILILIYKFLTKRK